MSQCLSLKEDFNEHVKKLLYENNGAKNCQVVGENGTGMSSNLLLAAVSPWLKDLLQATPPYIDGCLILPDIDWTDISEFLESLTQPGQVFIVANELVKLLGIVTSDVKVTKEEGGFNLESDNDLQCGADYLEDDATENENIVENKVNAKSIPCPYCKKLCISEISLKTHLKINHGEKGRTIDPIESDDISSKIKTELGKDHLSRSYKCEICQRYFDTENGLNVHNSTKHNELDDPNGRFIFEAGMFWCRVCNKQYKRKDKVLYHLKSSHKLGAKFTCEYCNKLYYYENELRKHLRTHKQEKEFFCEQCGEGFVWKDTLIRHRHQKHLSQEEREVLNETLKKHMCDLCGQAFKFQCLLREHMESHSIIKKYNCEVCGKTFRTKKMMLSHRRSIHLDTPQKKKVKTEKQKAIQAARARRYRAIKSGKIGPYDSVPGDEQFEFKPQMKLVKI